MRYKTQSGGKSKCGGVAWGLNPESEERAQEALVAETPTQRAEGETHSARRRVPPRALSSSRSRRPRQ